MPSREIEIILMRQLASYLATPVFVVDPDGTLAFYNESAESILGQRFDETGEMSASEWASAFVATDEAGRPLPPESLPVMIALREGRPAHGSFVVQGLDRVSRHIDVVAFPLIGQQRRLLGAVAIFQEGGSR